MRTSIIVNHDGTARLTLDGEIDLQVKDTLDGTLRDLLSSDAAAIVIDLTAVTFLDSSGIGTLVRGSRQAELAGKGFQITGAQGMVLRVLQVTGVAELLTGPATATTTDPL